MIKHNVSFFSLIERMMVFTEKQDCFKIFSLELILIIGNKAEVIYEEGQTFSTKMVHLWENKIKK